MSVILIDVEATHMMCLEVHALPGNVKQWVFAAPLLLSGKAFAALVIAAADCLAARVSSLSTAAAALTTFLSIFTACFAALICLA